MPNAPAMVGHGMAATVRSKGASIADEKFALKIFHAVGDAVALKYETLLDSAMRFQAAGLLTSTCSSKPSPMPR